MTREEAELYAKNMTYREAIHNLIQARSIPYRKATFIKINKLLNELEQEPKVDVLDKIKAEIEQIADEEQKYDEKWAIGLRYAVKIIDKYKAESEEV